MAWLFLTLMLLFNSLLIGSLKRLTYILSLQKIENFSDVKGGAAMEILSLYTLQEGATVAKLLRALNELERFDILLSLVPLLEGSIKFTSKDAKVSKDFFAFWLLDLFNGKSNDDNCKSREDSGVLSGSDSGMEIVGSFVGEADVANLESAPVLCNTSLSQTVSGKKKLKNTVLLTFAQDGRELAYKVAREIRRLDLGICVLILEENEEEMDACSESIYRWFLEVFYI